MANTNTSKAASAKPDSASAPKAVEVDESKATEPSSTSDSSAPAREDSERPERISKGASQADAVRDEIRQDGENVAAGKDAAEARETQYLVGGEVPASAPGTEGLPRE